MKLVFIMILVIYDTSHHDNKRETSHHDYNNK